jgi:hypothetical protein
MSGNSSAMRIASDLDRVIGRIRQSDQLDAATRWTALVLLGTASRLLKPQDKGRAAVDGHRQKAEPDGAEKWEMADADADNR